ncbi:unnamed protein product [Prunus armeniaca]
MGLAQLLLSWEPPGLDMLKLNVDGSRRAASGCIGTDGVIGGANGDWICGFAVNLGKGCCFPCSASWNLELSSSCCVDSELLCSYEAY